ncbi:MULTISPECIES: hypothetical protein [unclassified Vibrio]|uniref:hypothetical protein n=1 Tax=unclassified Vibrio TaxID=2614977 RepID=UPI003550EDC1
MSTLQAIPTQHGIDILNGELKNTVTKYRLLGALTHDAPSESLYSFYENTIETSYYDDNGVLTFILNLPIEQHFDEYLHQVHVLDSNNQAVIECSTPKVALAKGIGGMVTLKASISGEAGDVIFKHGEFVTETELNELHLAPIQSDLTQLKNVLTQEVFAVGFIDNAAYQVFHPIPGAVLTVPETGKYLLNAATRCWEKLRTGDFAFWSMAVFVNGQQRSELKAFGVNILQAYSNKDTTASLSHPVELNKDDVLQIHVFIFGANGSLSFFYGDNDNGGACMSLIKLGAS